MTSILTLSKCVAERILLHGFAPLARRRERGSLILAYHNVVPDGVARRGDSSLHLPLSSFVAQVELLAAECEVVPLRELLLTRRTAGRPRVAVTFDDAYRGAVELAVPMLSAAGLPATIFVAPGLLGRGAPWWDQLADASPDEWTEQARERALTELRGDAALVLAEAGLGSTGRPLPDMMEIVPEESLAAVAEWPGVALGSHTWSHRNLAVLSEAELIDECRRALEWLHNRVSEPLAWLAFPYGRYSPAAIRVAREAGYEAALRVNGGWIGANPQSNFELPRFNVPAGLSTAGFRLRLSGICAH